MQFRTILAAIALATATNAALPVPRELANAARAGTLEERGWSCDTPIIGGTLCTEHCKLDHDNKVKCTGVCVS
jgi:hypothetical protein